MKTTLRIILIIVGLRILVPSAVGLFLPWGKMISYMNYWQVTMPKAVDSPITVYLCRVVCITFAWTSMLFFLAACDLEKYLTLIRFLALASIFIGLTFILVGSTLDLPAFQFLFDGIFCLFVGGLIWTLSSFAPPQAKHEPSVPKTDQ